MKSDWLNNVSPTAKELYELYDDVRLFEKNNPMIFTVSNNGVVEESVRIFGANRNRFEPNFGNSAAPAIVITYAYQSYSYLQLLANTMFAPFEIGTIRLESLTAIQSKVLNASVLSPEGIRHTIALTLFHKLNQNINNSVELNVEDKKIPVDGDTQILFSLPAGERLTFYIYPSKLSSLKMLINTGTLAKKYTTLQIPLTPNRDSDSIPITVKYNDYKRLVA